MNILLLGKSGQVGWELQRSLSVLGRVTALGHDEADFTQPQAVAQTVRALRPDVIVNAAAHTAVDKAEGEPARARLLNATTPGVLAEEAARLGAWLVHYSTDYVFDGSGDRPWVKPTRPRRCPSMAPPSSRASGSSSNRAAGISSCAPAGSMPRAAATSPKPCCASRRSVNA